MFRNLAGKRLAPELAFLGVAALFFFPPFGCTFGEAALDRKMEVSHRAQALRQMRAYLDGLAG